MKTNDHQNHVNISRRTPFAPDLSGSEVRALKAAQLFWMQCRRSPLFLQQHRIELYPRIISVDMLQSRLVLLGTPSVMHADQVKP